MNTKEYFLEEAERLYPGIKPCKLSGEAVFADFTYLSNVDTENWVQFQCLVSGCFCFIDYHPDFKCRVFHGLHNLTTGLVSVKPLLHEYFDILASRSMRQEEKLETEIADWLADQGCNPRRQVRCKAGIADIVTDTAIYEIKLRLNTDDVFKAIGQVLLYREAINPNLTPFIIGFPGDVKLSVIELATKLGIKIDEWF